MKKVLIVGYGSIGRRHRRVLEESGLARKIDVVSSRPHDGEEGLCRYPSLDALQEPEAYDYFIVANETSRHHETLRELGEAVKGKTILVEKPLFHRFLPAPKKGTNRIFVAYNLRFHPVIEALKREMEGERILYANVLAGQHLPDWRPERDYRKTYSASIAQGGGVLRDLSHELDYAAHLFGPLELFCAVNDKVSELEIESDDLFAAVGRGAEGAVVCLTMDYLSRKPMRRIVVHTNGATYEADLIASTLEVTEEEGRSRTLHFPCGRDETYEKMHKALLEKEGEGVCTLEEGLATLEIIERYGYHAAKGER